MNKNLFVAIALTGLVLAGLATYLLQDKEPVPARPAAETQTAAVAPQAGTTPASINFSPAGSRRQ